MNPIAAKLPGICPACGGAIQVGSLMVKDPVRGRWVHALCASIGDTASTASITAVTWASLMFDSVPSELRPKVYRALSRALHPDMGGDTRSMQTLAAAWDKHKNGAA